MCDFDTIDHIGDILARERAQSAVLCSLSEPQAIRLDAVCAGKGESC